MTTKIIFLISLMMMFTLVGCTSKKTQEDEITVSQTEITTTTTNCSSSEMIGETCTDGIDNDCDSLIDIKDSDCQDFENIPAPPQLPS